MVNKILYFLIIMLLPLLYCIDSVYGESKTVEISKVRFIFQDGSSEIKEVTPSVSFTFYENDTTYDRVHLGQFIDLAGKDIIAINLYTGDGWLKAGVSSTTEDLNNPDIYDILGGNAIDTEQYSAVTTKCYYNGNTWQPASPGPDPVPTPDPAPTPDNSAPSINQLITNPASITYPNTAEVSFDVSDPDSDDISWTGSISGGADKGSLSSNSGIVSDGSGSVAITYTPENTDGSFAINISLDDGHGNADSDSVMVTVISAPTNNSPQINNLTINPASITYPNTAEVSFDVSDPDSDDISWTGSISGGADKGSLSRNSGTVSGGSGNVSITYTPENTDGSFTINISLDDGHGNADSDSVVVTIISVPTNNSPQISNLTASPNPIEDPPYKSYITFDVDDADGDDIDWTAAITAGPLPQGKLTPTSGTVNGGSGSVSTRYQPVGGTPNGTFTVTIELGDGNGGTDAESIDIELNK